MSDIEYVMVMHDGNRAAKFMSEDYCKDLMEQLAAAQSPEVCTVAHSAEVLEFCPYCKIERMRELLRQCIPSLQRDGRPHVVTMVQAALGDITADSAPDRESVTL